MTHNRNECRAAEHSAPGAGNDAGNQPAKPIFSMRKPHVHWESGAPADRRSTSEICALCLLQVAVEHAKQSAKAELVARGAPYPRYHHGTAVQIAPRRARSWLSWTPTPS